MGKYFGTDGVRGIANTELTPEFTLKLGRILGYQLKMTCEQPKVLIGRDTRISGEMLEAALMAGLISSGVDVLKLGVITTPGVAYLTKTLDVQAGIMISASHNPVQDNGIKIFSHNGYKLSDTQEEEIEALLDVADELPRPIGEKIGRVEDYRLGASSYLEHLKSTISHSLAGLKVVLDCANGASSCLAPKLFHDLGADVVSICHEPNGINIRLIGGEIGRVEDYRLGASSYLEHLKSTISHSLAGLKVVLDCANGASSFLAPQLFHDLGAEVISICCEPNGININEACGSTHPQTLAKAVVEHGADLGFAFDGDCDRLMVIVTD